MTTSADQYRAEFDAVVSFSNGGGLQAQGFRVDVPGPDVTEEQVAILFVTSLGLLTTERVEVQRLRLLAEPHKGARGGPSEQHAARTRTTRRLIELSHVIEAGMVTYPGLPGPEITPHLTRAHRPAERRHPGRRAPDRPCSASPARRPVQRGPATGGQLRHLPRSRLRDRRDR